MSRRRHLTVRSVDELAETKDMTRLPLTVVLERKARKESFQNMPQFLLIVGGIEATALMLHRPHIGTSLPSLTAATGNI